MRFAVVILCVACWLSPCAAWVPLLIPRLLSVPEVQRLSVEAGGGRRFNLTLVPSRSVFTGDTEAAVVRGEELDASRLAAWTFRGGVDGDPRSRLSATLPRGLFDGRFSVGGRHYRLEPYERYFRQKNPSYNAVFFEEAESKMAPGSGSNFSNDSNVWNVSNVEVRRQERRRRQHVPQLRRSALGGNEMNRALEHVLDAGDTWRGPRWALGAPKGPGDERSAVDSDEHIFREAMNVLEKHSPTQTPATQRARTDDLQRHRSLGPEPQQATVPDEVHGGPRHQSAGQLQLARRRPRPQASGATYDDDASLICDLKVVVDFRFWAGFRHEKRELANYVSQLLGPVDVAFRRLDADGDGRPDNIGFFVSSLLIHTEPVHPNFSHPDPPFDPRDLLAEMALYDFDGACAGLLLTDRRMSMRANPTRLSQGICATHRPPTPPPPPTPPGDHDADYGDYFANARVVNFRGLDRHNFNGPAVHTLHQLAHLFGAKDDTDTCTGSPADEANRYLTSYPPPSGYELNNWRFSECAAADIGDFLRRYGRACLKWCNATQCDYPMDRAFVGLLEPRQLNPTQRRFTEHCVTVPRSEAPPSPLTPAVALILAVATHL